MSSLDQLAGLLNRYDALPRHHDPVLAQQVEQITQWQTSRLARTHARLFAEPQNRLMGDYFLHRLYGSTADFAILAEQFRRLLPLATRLESFVPNTALRTGTLGIALSVNNMELDDQLAPVIFGTLGHQGALTDEVMRQAYLLADQQPARLQLLTLLDELGQGLDKYVRSFLVQGAFRLARNTAYRHGFAPVYDFTGEGFAAMKPLKSASGFISQFTRVERDIIERVHRGDSQPFQPV